MLKFGFHMCIIFLCFMNFYFLCEDKLYSLEQLWYFSSMSSASHLTVWSFAFFLSFPVIMDVLCITEAYHSQFQQLSKNWCLRIQEMFIYICWFSGSWIFQQCLKILFKNMNRMYFFTTLRLLFCLYQFDAYIFFWHS